MGDDITEVLCEDEIGEFFWPMCARDKCLNGRTHDDALFCYPHSRWYRRFLVPINLLITTISNTMEQNQ